MKDQFIPQTLRETCDPNHIALLVYDVQVGIFGQIPNSSQILANVLSVLGAARKAGIPIFFTRHLSLPKKVMGTFQLRMAMEWQKVNTVDQVSPWFLRESPSFSLTPELKPTADEVIIDKITMSAFEGTFLNIALRDAGINSFIIVGAAMEIGIEPTVRHGSDLGFIPIIVSDACGYGNKQACERSMDSLNFAGYGYQADSRSICNLLEGVSV